MKNNHQATIFGEQLLLHPLRVIYWQREKALLLSDLHLGKAAHFRRHGLPVPTAVSDSNWDKLISVLLDCQPERVVFLGDLFHSDLNEEWDDFCQLTEQFAHIRFELVLGNHDILHTHHYEQAGLQIHREDLLLEPFVLSHHPLAVVQKGWYNLAGHIHPCVWLRGRGRQRLKLPCFYFGERQGILPAFGAFTGSAEVEVKNGDQVFVIAENQVVAV